MPPFEFGRSATPAPDGRLDAPAFHRNHAPIWSVLEPRLRNETGDVLEVGSGTGQHVVAFARAAPHLVWWPSDCSDAHLRSIAAWRAASGLPNIRPPLHLDLAAPDWALDAEHAARLHDLTAIFCANVLHIAPFVVTEGLLAGAALRLKPGRRLYIYGPFMRDGQHTAPSNAAFDASLRAQDPAWGVRDIADIAARAAAAGLALIETVPMPANNFTLVLERTG